ncbi:MAG: DUF1549 and DUF1553 domain-containing protein [Gemmataceae bacterium]|nr:DUF1549 and DUF1553 domain-containing protein [Gemmataceae bacterium]
MKTAHLRSRLGLRHQLFGLVAFLALTAPIAAAPSEKDKAEVIGQPVSLHVLPETIVLNGPRATLQIIVSGKYADGSVRDLTPFCTLQAEAADLLAIDAGGFLVPKKEGASTLIVTAGGQTARVPVAVKDFSKPQPVSFRNDFIASLNVGGCNSGACHGTPSGKGGFKLSLRGYDPSADYLQLTRDVLGRRADRLDPDASLILQKALGIVPHEGGQRFKADTIPAKTIRSWVAEGLQDDPANQITLKKIEVLPGGRVLNAPSKWQQLAVLGHFSDGSIRDVTRLTVFSSSDAGIADVGPTGLVEFTQSGEVAILCRYLEEMYPVRLTYLEPKKDFKWSNPPENNYVDKHVFAKLKMLSILPSDLCTDQEFVRRVYLDVCGVLPTPEEVRKFLDDKAADKRAKLIDALLERPEYADFWTMKWSDVLRSNRKTIQLKGIHVYQQWVHGNIKKNTGWDQVVRDLVTSSGSTFANPPANFYRIARDPQNLAETTAQLFFGIRMQCAKCHNHPFERWTQDDYYSMAAFFARVRQKKDTLEVGPTPQTLGAEIIYSARSGDGNIEVTQPRTNKVMPPKFMGGAVPTIKPGQDRREVLADWMTSGDNPFFAKSVVNRIWFHLNGRGIVDPVDDFRDSNPSANDELLDALAKDYIAHKFDNKYIIRTMLNSRTYQLSAQSNDFNKDDNKYFSHATTKLLSAEPLLDAICSATDVPEKFQGLPLGTRAVQLPDGEVNHVFLKTFGQPGRELACECEREGDSNLAQALQLINGPTINEKTRNANNRLGKLIAAKKTDKEILDELYLATLSRLPMEGEVKAALGHVDKAANVNGDPQAKRKAWEDVQWALLNAKEFLFRH